MASIEGADEPVVEQRAAGTLIAIVVAVTLAVFFLVDTALAYLNINTWVDRTSEAVILGLAAAWPLWYAVLKPLRADATRERQLTRAREQLLMIEAKRQEFDSTLHRALEMAETEDKIYDIARRVFGRVTSRMASELLLADSSGAHLKRSATGGADPAGPECRVESPRSCPAIRRSKTLVFESSEAIDACPYLSERPGGELSAVCVPVSVAGHSIGVLHSTASPGSPATPTETHQLEALATQAGARIGMLRVMKSTNLQAATDPLTGLLNRRSFENQMHDLIRSQQPFALAMADLDHFKRLNDTHGHDAGDRALRLFSRVMRSALRSEDLVSRYGGEEFVVAFPGQSPATALGALQRVQEELVLALTAGTVPSFTASFGITHSDDANSLEDLCRIADAALFRAKKEGRNRIIVNTGARFAETTSTDTAPTERPDR